MGKNKSTRIISNEVLKKIIFHIDDQFLLLQRLGKLQEEQMTRAAEHFTDKHIERMYLIGCGTSLNTALIGKRISEYFLKIPTEAMNAFEFMAHTPSAFLTRGTTVVAISQSGETTCTVQAAQRARDGGCYIVAVTSAPSSTLANVAHVTLLTHVIDEKIGPKTKGYTASLVTLYRFFLSLAQERNTISAHEIEELSGQLEKIPYLFKKFLDVKADRIKNLGKQFREIKHIIITATGFDLGVAEEVALKIIEMCKIPAEAQTIEEMMHGRLDMVNQNTGLIMLIPQESGRSKMIEVARAATDTGAFVILIVNGEQVDTQPIRLETVVLPGKFDGLFSPLCNLLLLQYLIYYIALEKTATKGRN